MSRSARGRSAPPEKQNLFARLLILWADYRRPILLVVTAAGLSGFLAALQPETRRQLVFGLLAQRNLVILLLGFVLLTFSLLLSAGQRLDASVFLLFNLRGYHPLWLDRAMWAFTQIGNGAAGILLGVALYFIGFRRMAVEMLLGIMSLWLVVELIKALVERSRPFLALESTRVVGYRERGLSFPSGHTSQAFYMATVLAYSFEAGGLLGGLIYGVAAIVGFTRIYVGAHYPRDVIGGAILGSVWGIITSLAEAYLSGGLL
jgi:membrane-associated phospholipid phosphatase